MGISQNLPRDIHKDCVTGHIACICKDKARCVMSIFLNTPSHRVGQDDIKAFGDYDVEMRRSGHERLPSLLKFPLVTHCILGGGGFTGFEMLL